MLSLHKHTAKAKAKQNREQRIQRREREKKTGNNSIHWPVPARLGPVNGVDQKTNFVQSWQKNQREQFLDNVRAE